MAARIISDRGAGLFSDAGGVGQRAVIRRQPIREYSREPQKPSVIGRRRRVPLLALRSLRALLIVGENRRLHSEPGCACSLALAHVKAHNKRRHTAESPE